MKKILISIFLLTISGLGAYAGHVPEHIDGDEIDYRYYKREGVLEYRLPESYIKDSQKLFHFYGYLSSMYSHEENPFYYSDDSLLNEKAEDNYTTNKLYLVNVLQFTNDTVWDTIFDGTYREYEQHNALDDSYFRIMSGPSFLMPNNNTKISTKLLYGGEWEYHRKKFGSIGALLKVNHSFFNNFNSTFYTEIERRNYNADTTEETDRYVYSTFFMNRFYLDQAHVFRITPLYKYFNTDIDYQDKKTYGITFDYTYFPKNINFYIGLRYEYLKTDYKAPEPPETYTKTIYENEYSSFIGYNFIENLSLQFSYAYKRIHTNQTTGIIRGKDNSFSLSLVYKFHLI